MSFSALQLVRPPGTKHLQHFGFCERLCGNVDLVGDRFCINDYGQCRELQLFRTAHRFVRDCCESNSQTGYTFSPSIASVALSSASKTSLNFIGTAIVVTPPIQVPVPHSVTLTWNSSTSHSISGYNVYRSSGSGGSYIKLNTSPIPTTSYLDSSVVAGQTYFYVATTVQNATESSYSAQTVAVIPTP
jgi:hypothetical protein